MNCLPSVCMTSIDSSLHMSTNNPLQTENLLSTPLVLLLFVLSVGFSLCFLTHRVCWSPGTEQSSQPASR